MGLAYFFAFVLSFSRDVTFINFTSVLLQLPDYFNCYPPFTVICILSEIIKDLSCDFEDKSNKLCNYKVGRKDQGSWKRSLGNSELSFDHTRKDKKGESIL